MRILKKNLKHGAIKVQAEDADDLWDLNTIIDENDRIRASTERKIKLGGSDEKSRVIKRRVTLTITADKISYTPEEVRVLGPIVDGPDDMPRGSAHSISITPGTDATIIKEHWPNYQLQRLKESTQARHTILVVLFDREQALYLKVTARGTKELMRIKGNVNKKGLDEQKQNTFYAELIQHVQTYDERLDLAGIIMASPAFWQEYAKKKLPKNLKVTFTTISDVEKTAVKELIKRPELQKILKNNRAAMELGFVEEAMTALAHDKLAYGDKDVKEAIKIGNAKALFITEERISKDREQEVFGKTERLLKEAESAGASVHIISTEAEDKIKGLGGIVAIKRW